jgi:hypothetical protein
MTVVGRDARRRWAIVAACVAVLCALPVAVSAWPGKKVQLDARELRDLIARSAGRPYQGYAESVGTLGLPQLPRLGQVAALLSGNTRLRAWYAKKDRWRVDVIDTGQERGVYRTPETLVTWDYGANQLAVVELGETGVIVVDPGPITSGEATTVEQFTYMVGESSSRLPRGADLMPPDLARRLLDLAEGDRFTAIAGRRVAGIDAAGLRISTDEPQSTIGHIDIWADPKTGLPLRIEITARNAERPILVTRFLDVAQTTPSDEVLAPPVGHDGLSVANVSPDDSFDLFEPNFEALPRSIGGLRRWEEPDTPASNGVRVVRFTPGVAYGAGLTRIAVVNLSRRLGNDVLRAARGWGTPVTLPDAVAVLIAAPLLSVMVVHIHSSNETYLLAGMVDGVHMQRFGEALAGSR